MKNNNLRFKFKFTYVRLLLCLILSNSDLKFKHIFFANLDESSSKFKLYIDLGENLVHILYIVT